MNKAILVIDEMPKCCNNCPCNYEDNHFNWRCGATKDYLYGEEEEKRPSWCPLKELPQRIYNIENYEGIAIPTQDDYTKGFNDCLEEIERKM